MLENTCDVMQGKIGNSAVFITCEQVLTVFTQGLVDVHTVAVIANQGFRHKGHRLAVTLGDIHRAVFHGKQFIRLGYQCFEFCTDFRLAGRRYFMVMHLDRLPHIL